MAFLNWLSTATGAAQVRSRIQNDPFHRLQSAEEIAIAAALGLQIDVNKASVDDWLRLPGISIHQARNLSALTQSGLSFHCVEDVAAAIGVPMQRLEPLAALLRFCFYDPDSVETITAVNPNTASLERLLRIPGVDLHLAQAIVQGRSRSPYRNLSHLQTRLSLPAQVTASLLHYLQF